IITKANEWEIEDHMKKFLIPFPKLVYLLLGLVIGLVIANINELHFLQNWKFEYNSAAVEYLKVLLGWPSVVLFIVMTFFYKFANEIAKFIKNMKLRYGDIEAISQQEQSEIPGETNIAERSEVEIIKLSKQDVQSFVEEFKTLEKQ